MIECRELKFDEVKNIKIKEYGVDVLNSGKYYGLFINDNLISFLNILHYKGYIKFRVNYTFPKYRGNGYFSLLLSYVMRLYFDLKMKADCLDSSYKIYMQKGFKIVKEKQFKKFTVHYMERSEYCGN